MTQNIMWAARVVNAVTTRIDLSTFPGKLQPSQLIVSHFTLDQIVQAYDTFDHSMKVEALKVIVTNEIMMEKSMEMDGKNEIPFPVAVSPRLFP